MLLPLATLRRRVARLQALVAYLERLPPESFERYASDIALQLRIERVIQLCAQIVVDTGSALLRLEQGHEPPVSPRMEADPPALDSLMDALAEAGILPRDLCSRLGDLPELALLLIHEHEEVEPRAIWSLWTERRRELAAAAAAFSSYLTRKKIQP